MVSTPIAVCPLCHSPVQPHSINFYATLSICINDQCTYPFQLDPPTFCSSFLKTSPSPNGNKLSLYAKLQFESTPPSCIPLPSSRLPRPTPISTPTPTPTPMVTLPPTPMPSVSLSIAPNHSLSSFIYPTDPSSTSSTPLRSLVSYPKNHTTPTPLPFTSTQPLPPPSSTMIKNHSTNNTLPSSSSSLLPTLTKPTPTSITPTLTKSTTTTTSSSSSSTSAIQRKGIPSWVVLPPSQSSLILSSSITKPYPNASKRNPIASTSCTSKKLGTMTSSIYSSSSSSSSSSTSTVTSTSKSTSTSKVMSLQELQSLVMSDLEDLNEDDDDEEEHSDSAASIQEDDLELALTHLLNGS